MADRTAQNARVFGLAVFLLGIGLLAVVFIVAWRLMGRAASATVPANLPLDALRLAGRVGLLFVLGYVASSIAGRGVQLFLAAQAADQPTAMPGR